VGRHCFCRILGGRWFDSVAVLWLASGRVTVCFQVFDFFGLQSVHWTLINKALLLPHRDLTIAGLFVFCVW
jgi:hypothetical protein